jgi:hypothetical protein
MTMFDPSDHIPEAVHGMDGYDEIYCSCGWDSTDPKDRGWLAHLPDSLDAAWAEAEAALPEGWTLSGVHRSGQRGQTKRQAYIAAAWGGRLLGQSVAPSPEKGRRIAYADSPAAALRALAKRLREMVG